MLLQCANDASPTEELVAEALRHASAAPLPTWMRRDSEGLLNNHQVATALAFLAYSQPELTRLFEAYSDGTTMDRARWLEFVRAEQFGDSMHVARDSVSGGMAGASETTGQSFVNQSTDAALHEAEVRFEQAVREGGDGELATDDGLELQQFVRQVLSPANNAVTPAVEQDLHAPLAHYCGATSHNSYIIGDQLTGLSSADAYRRQLLQGCRHVEIDCWDGKKGASVTHGYTFVTVESFGAVAQAVAETAFVTSELPVILSLEMHCSAPQQKEIAELLRHHLGPTLLTYE